MKRVCVDEGEARGEGAGVWGGGGRRCGEEGMLDVLL